MPAGFQCFNDGSFIQIDADYKNYEFSQKGTFTIGPSNLASGGSSLGTVTVTVNGSFPVLAINCAELCYASLKSRSGQTFTFEIYNGNNYNISGEYFVFDASNANSAGNVGMQIFNASAELVYDTNKKYMRVLDYFSPAGASADETRSYPGKKTAYVMADFGYRFVVQASPTQPGNSAVRFLQSWLHLGRTPSGQFQVKDTATFTNANANNSGQQSTSEYPSRWMIIDVTGI